MGEPTEDCLEETWIIDPTLGVIDSTTKMTGIVISRVILPKGILRIVANSTTEVIDMVIGIINWLELIVRIVDNSTLKGGISPSVIEDDNFSDLLAIAKEIVNSLTDNVRGVADPTWRIDDPNATPSHEPFIDILAVNDLLKLFKG